MPAKPDDPADRRPLHIYVSGPYTPSLSDRQAGREAEAIERNVVRANRVALDLAKRGHYPFIPHTMMKGWEDVHRMSTEQILDICLKWVERCDALFFIEESTGARSELDYATKLGLRIFDDLDEVPDVAKRP
ncbi:MAG: DUF4406 domain-containing protein [Actinomycetia bacterium]|nr:DUF4406 domain-containing protein [Actinomycetes bacterium]